MILSTWVMTTFARCCLAHCIANRIPARDAVEKSVGTRIVISFFMTVGCFSFKECFIELKPPCYACGHSQADQEIHRSRPCQAEQIPYARPIDEHDDKPERQGHNIAGKLIRVTESRQDIFLE